MARDSYGEYDPNHPTQGLSAMTTPDLERRLLTHADRLASATNKHDKRTNELLREAALALSSARAAGMEWQPIETAPKDGTKIWGWLYDGGIVLMHWMSAEANAEADGSDNPDEYISCWVKSGEISNGDWSLKFWMPFEAITVPPGVVWKNCRWRDLPSPPSPELREQIDQEQK